MTQYNSLNVKLSNSQLTKLKSDESEVVLRLSSDMIGDDETSFLHKLIDKLQLFVNPLQANHQLISNYQKFNYLR